MNLLDRVRDKPFMYILHVDGPFPPYNGPLLSQTSSPLCRSRKESLLCTLEYQTDRSSVDSSNGTLNHQLLTIILQIFLVGEFLTVSTFSGIPVIRSFLLQDHSLTNPGHIFPKSLVNPTGPSRPPIPP